MTKKWLLALAVAGLSLASAKTYTVTLYEPSELGTTQLSPGKYKVKVDGTTALLMDARNRQVAANLKVENLNKRFDNNELEFTKNGGVDRIQEIHLGGTRMKVDVNN